MCHLVVSYTLIVGRPKPNLSSWKSATGNRQAETKVNFC